MIPFLDLTAAYRELQAEIDSAVHRVLSSGHYILGQEVEAFESEYARYCGSRFCVGVGNGLDALHLSLVALGVGTGDEVIVPTNTYIATWLAVSHCGATPVPVEPLESTHNLDPAGVAAAVTPRTKVILPVHLYGQPADLDSMRQIANDHGLKIVEDAAQAHGARYRGRTIGAHSDLVAWSFYPGKNLGAMGDAGAITTDDETLAERLRRLRNYGSAVKYFHQEKGFNSRLDPIQAAILRVRLKVLDSWNHRRATIAERYRRELDGSRAILPSSPDWALPSWHLFVIRHPQRDELQRRLADAGIVTLIHYPIPPHHQKAYEKDPVAARRFAIAEALAKEVLSLPIFPHLSEEQISAVSDAFSKLS